ncbi:2Fe-2S iron-sulfur cluster-binding protein [Sphingobium sp. JS3065]|uniref:2Fe-2S iron-sulfur cluster-binding protein n=1 Tax=Sphingobium sp. JS3065 TaxID=2970925 RepID=UPI002264043C|nr:2Fe-2S iron-sulfur cluster-binding protein [Sphingobium sp. JS3065]UZW56374.1 2Fe-2S iron-sulfur cluster-binding protein [Sphingobium sp. JS3065]
MMELFVVTRSGATEKLHGEEGATLLDAIRGSGNDELQALCGGSCSCATCHVLVDEEWIGRVGHAEGDECELLEGSSHKGANSRLSCQVKLEPGLSGLRVVLAPEE